MQEILKTLLDVDGVMGCGVYSPDGILVSHRFPSLLDAAAVTNMGKLLVECISLQQAEKNLDLLDFRFADGRVIVKDFSKGLLCLVCGKNVSMQGLHLPLKLSANKLETIFKDGLQTPEAPPETKAEDAKASGLFLKVGHLASVEASNSFDQLGMVALNQPTTKQISDYFGKPAKKITITNRSSGNKGTFPVMLINDAELRYTGMVVIGPGIAKKLSVAAGDEIDVSL